MMKNKLFSFIFMLIFIDIDIFDQLTDASTPLDIMQPSTNVAKLFFFFMHK